MFPSFTPDKYLWSLLLFSHTQAISQVSFPCLGEGNPGSTWARERDAARQYCSTLWLSASHDWKSHKRHNLQPQPDNKSPFRFHESPIYPSRSYILQKAYTWVSCMHISENKQLIWNEKIPAFENEKKPHGFGEIFLFEDICSLHWRHSSQGWRFVPEKNNTFLNQGIAKPSLILKVLAHICQ